MPSAMPLDPLDVLPGDAADAPALKAAIKRRWECEPHLLQTVPVRADLQGHSWNVIVHVFELKSCFKAPRAYAWASPIDGTSRRRVCVSAHIGPIKSPADAVWAAIADEVRERRLAGRQPEPAEAKSKSGKRWLKPKLQALGF